MTLFLFLVIAQTPDLPPLPAPSVRAKAVLKSESLPPLPERNPIAAIVLYNGPRHRKRVALTFDACAKQPASRVDEKLIEVLAEQAIPATVFFSGKWMLEHPAETVRIAELPNIEVGNHSFLHPHMMPMKFESIRVELLATERILFALTGKQSRFFRPPYGEFSPRMVQVASELGLVTLLFDVPSGDSDEKMGKTRLVKWVSGQARAGSVVILHINGRGWNTAAALPEIVAALKEQELELVTLSQMFDDDEFEPEELSSAASSNK